MDAEDALAPADELRRREVDASVGLRQYEVRAGTQRGKFEHERVEPAAVVVAQPGPEADHHPRVERAPRAQIFAIVLQFAAKGASPRPAGLSGRLQPLGGRGIGVQHLGRLQLQDAILVTVGKVQPGQLKLPQRQFHSRSRLHVQQQDAIGQERWLALL